MGNVCVDNALVITQQCHERTSPAKKPNHTALCAAIQEGFVRSARADEADVDQEQR